MMTSPALPRSHGRTVMRGTRRLFAAGAILALLAAAVGAAVFWHNTLRHQFYPRNFGVVEPGRLYRSGQIAGRLIEPTLRQNHIRAIVALSATSPYPADTAAEIHAAADLHIDRQLFPLGGDGTGSVEVYAQAVAAVARDVRSNRPVLVHCEAGAQRTGGVIALYQLLVEHRPPEQVVAEMERFGHDPRQNPRLLQFLNQHMAELADRLVQLGVIDAVPRPLPVLHG